MRKDTWSSLKNLISEAAFPSNIYCISCGSMIDGTRPYSLCDRCIRKLHWIDEMTCEKCGKQLSGHYMGKLCYDCLMYDHYFTKGYSCLTYGLYERQLILDLKYNGRGYLAEKFGDILYDRISCENLCIDVIIPVPISRKKLRKRGYDQARLMAERLSCRTGVPADASILLRKKDTLPLSGMTPVQRQEALRDAFVIYPSKESGVKGKSVLLVDDIYTTGATADACSRKLSETGAEKIYLLVLASGGNRKPDI